MSCLIVESKLQFKYLTTKNKIDFELQKERIKCDRKRELNMRYVSLVN